MECVRVYCDYGYNSGEAYFDGIQLVRSSVETSLSSSDFVVESAGAEDDVDTVASVDTAPSFSEAEDRFGNTLTETTFADGEFGTIYRSFRFNADDGDMAGDDTGNNLVEETDARGNKTAYTVDADTSRNEEVTDRLGNKTAYEYDASGRTTKVTSKDAWGTELANVCYAYDTFDNMTEITRGDGMRYALAYNAFHNLESIGIAGKAEKLIRYTYKNGNGRLKEMTYANGDTMKATYNAIGQMVGETWFDKDGVETARYKYVYDSAGNIVRSIDISGRKEYNYEYGEGRILRATESDIALSGETVISKLLVHTVKYYYDTEGGMTRKVITAEDGSAQTVYYETNDDNTVVKFSAGGTTVTSHSKTDSFGRKVFDELQIGNGFVSRQFNYMPGAITDAHKADKKVKSTATTQLVSQIALSDGRTISYEYDKEERITKVTDTVEGTVAYTYDALGQLLTETVNGQIVNSMEYDNYGNITKKNGKAYTYGDATWRDLLTGFDGKTIEYDAQGNPVKYLGHTLTWEKGRQLKSFDGNTYTYNANGIRTSKTVNGVTHTYTLDGTKILRETWGDHTLIPLYDNEDSVCGILYNSVPYYFLKNLQGDVIAIVDKDAETVARYSYDAWGACMSATTCTELTNGVDVAAINPFRYKEYYYDSETALYYLQSRYYNATVGRFLNSDDIENLEYLNGPLDLNLFTYTVNCPIILTDGCGEGWLKDKINNVVNKVKKAVTTVVGATKKVVSTVKNGIKTVCTSVGDFFKNTVWKKWLVNGVWNTFCKKWVWEKFCKEMVYNTFIKKWVWETFCEKWTWETFCKKWVWQTFCKKWVWETFCKDWVANKAWNWFNGDKWYQSLVRNLTIGVVGGIVGALAVWFIPLLGTFAAATLGLTVLGGIITGIIGGIVSWLYDLIS